MESDPYEMAQFVADLREFAKDPVAWAAFVEVVSKTLQDTIDEDVVRAIYGEICANE